MHASLWAPWRLSYIQGLEQQSATARAGAATAGSSNFLRQYWENPGADAAQLVIHRTAQGMVLLNRYPYANGHLLVALGDPRPTLLEYQPAQRAHFWQLMDLAMALCQRVYDPQGLNVGLNVGRAAGAGLPEHVHGHVVPRWSGDTNFMSVMGEVRVIPQALEQSWELYRAALPECAARLDLA